ncbi:MAG: ABC transporter ATP-binding protein [Sphingomonadaceae bacterium]
MDMFHPRRKDVEPAGDIFSGEPDSLSLIRKIYAHLPLRRRHQAVLLLALILAGAFAELVTLAAVLPFLALVSDQARIESYPAVSGALRSVGLEPGRLDIAGAGLLFALIAIVAGGLRLLLLWAGQKYVFRIGHDLGVALFTRALYRRYAEHVKLNSSETLAGITKVQFVIRDVFLPLMKALSATIISVFILAALIAIDAFLAFLSLGLFGSVYVFIAFLTRRRLHSYGKVIARNQTVMTRTIQESLGSIRDILLGHGQPFHIAGFARLSSAMRSRQAGNAFISAAPMYLVQTVALVFIVALAVMLSAREGGLMAMLPVLGALALGGQRLLPQIQQLFLGWSRFLGNRQMMLDVLRLLERRDQLPAHRLRDAPPLPFERALELRNISFRYAPGEERVLKDVGLHVPKGARIGFLGRTGSGKTTLLDIVMGLLEPEDGEILVDGVPLTAANIAGWQTRISHVPQAIYLSDATLKENIAFGTDPGRIDMERVRKAARQAEIDAFIAQLPDGYDSEIGERGIRLSGGQRQRIGIARALYKEACVLVFDEATSALDEATESAIMRSIDRLSEEYTVLMIAHRISTLRNCDMLVRLGEGRIVETGSFEEVLGRGAARVAARGRKAGG